MGTIDREQVEGIRGRIASLSGSPEVSTQRAVELCMRDIEAAQERGCSLGQIAGELGLTRATLKSCMSRARKRMSAAARAVPPRPLPLPATARAADAQRDASGTLPERGWAMPANKAAAARGRFVPFRDTSDL